MDETQRRISRIARVAARFTSREMREQGVGPAEFDFMHMVRHHPGITQAEVCRRLDLDKGAAARQSARLEAKGYLRKEPDHADRRSQLLFATEKADELKNSRAHLEEAFYDWLLQPLSGGEREQLARMLEGLHRRSREERKEGFCHVREQMAVGEISAEESL